MRGSRLNGWQRIGIVASVAWAIGAWIDTTVSFNAKANSAFSQTLDICLTQRTEDGHYSDVKDCQNAAEEAHAIELLHKNEAAAFNALLPIPIVWLLVYGFIGLFRWIRRGFQPST